MAGVVETPVRFLLIEHLTVDRVSEAPWTDRREDVARARLAMER